MLRESDANEPKIRQVERLCVLQTCFKGAGTRSWGYDVVSACVRRLCLCFGFIMHAMKRMMVGGAR